MKKLLHELWTKPFDEYDDKNIRLLSLITGLLLHIAGITIIWFLVRTYMPTFSSIPPTKDDLIVGGSGGGGGNSKERVVEFGPSPGDEEATEEEKFKPEKVRIIRLRIVRPETQGTPVIAEVKEKKKKDKKEKSHMGSSLAKNFPPRQHIRGNGPGSGGGSGGGRGGGIGKGSGYSIDWGGTGNRRLISGRIPLYPKGTDKEMPVTLQFTVLPDGSVSKVIPLTKGDELLEREAIGALESWRFDPLPPANDQKFQSGRITFNFKLDHTTVHPTND